MSILQAILPFAGILIVGVSAVTTATVALAGVKLRTRDRTALWAATTALALVLIAVLTHTLTSVTELR